MIAMCELNDTFRSNVREIRLALGMTQADLANKLGVRRPCVTQVEAGKRVPSLDVVERYAKALGTTPENLLKKRGRLAG